MERGSRCGWRKGSDSEREERWQITIVIKMAIWMIKGSLGLQRWRNGRKRERRMDEMGMHLMSGTRSLHLGERTD